MNRKFEEYYEEIEINELNFLIEFMFQLTIIGRQVHHELSGESLELAAKQLNEINHRILNRVRDIGNEESWCKKEYLLKMIPHHIKLAPQIGNGVAFAASKAYSKTHA
jgi:hypothetical protein